MEGKKLSRIVKKFFGYKARDVVYDTDKEEVRCLLYDSFFFECNTNDRYGMFGACILFEKDKMVLTDFFNKRCSLNSDKESICESLQLVDEYCQKSLPDKFLKAYDKAYKRRL